jgi:hypothetical protein
MSRVCRPRAATAPLLLLLLTAGGEAGGDVLAEGRLRSSLPFLGTTIATLEVRTAPDRQATTITGATTTPFDSLPDPIALRRIVRLDRRLTWTLDLRDTTHTEVSFVTAQAVRGLSVFAALPPESLVVAPHAARDTVAGHAVQRVDVRWTFRPAPGVPAVPCHAEAWVARSGAAVESLLAFERRAARAGAAAPPPSPGPLAALSALSGPYFERLGGYPLRVRVRASLTGIPGAPPDDGAGAPGAKDADPAGMTTLAVLEIITLRAAPAPPRVFELPPRSKRVSSPEEDLLELGGGPRPGAPPRRPQR